MNREIKFRAWDKKRGLMSEIWQSLGNDSGDSLVPFSKGAPADALDLEWMQFTNLTDKNGKEIYEGDVVRVSDTGDDEDDGNYKVCYLTEMGAWYLDHLTENYESIDGIHMPRLEEDNRDESFGVEETIGSLFTEIIGNIYENPELLAPTTDL